MPEKISIMPRLSQAPALALSPAQAPVSSSTPAPAPIPKKYNIGYTNTGNIVYGGQTIGNLLYSDLVDIGEDVWLENWAKNNGIELLPNSEWLSINGQQRNTSTSKLQHAATDRIDPSEQSLIDSMGVSAQERSSDKPQESTLSGLKALMPLDAPVNLGSLDQVQQWQDSQQGYGKGFEPSALNPFFEK